MALNKPAPPWVLECPWCKWNVVVFNRGSRGDDQGSGVEAATLGANHARHVHNRSWIDFVKESDK